MFGNTISKKIRPFPVERDERRVSPHVRDIRLKVLSDIDAYIRQREYGKASSLLQTILNTGAIQVKEIWNPLTAVIRAQDHTALGVFLDLIITETRAHPPFAASMERFFVALDSNYDDAYAIILAFSTDTGSKLAMAHGFLGIIIACLRELEVRRTNAFTACAHVFKHSEFAQFAISGGEQKTKYSLTNAERHLERALELDPECDFFVPFHAQVLVALGKPEHATHMLEQRYTKDKNIVVLRMLMSLDPRDVVEQTDRMLDYLELDPFALEKYFIGFITRCIDHWAQLSIETISRLFLIIIDRIERGDPLETDKWKYMAHFTSQLRTDYPHVVGSAMDERVQWWHMYFDWPQFTGTVNDLVVYKAVCALQLFDLEQGHPVYNVLSGELTDNQATFVNSIQTSTD
ncbi:hypothetical protein IWW35_001646 [Coemansia sp. RSA 1878]|nr:hypothetical protein IWW35_001646 [Coemansia sp. RSA 1878]